MHSTASPSSLSDWLARKPANKQVKRIPAMSEKRKREAAIYSKKRKAFLDDKRICYAGPFLDHLGIPMDCRMMASDVHHREGRLGGNYLDESTWLPVCRYCHEWIHQHPKTARHLGLLD